MDETDFLVSLMQCCPPTEAVLPYVGDDGYIYWLGGGGGGCPKNRCGGVVVRDDNL